ncbi:glycosyl transferase [Streptomyces sp. NRRL F-4489]|uniref:glycosyltransferase n=1 Tax=Streptomyces sp. NRRL F-4489 TaxID=1609095 RepID=UPI000746817D|nr:glycosyltransferase [Streptomyces sp. NRRL F-4489]KUL33870.1 glycosyl transferase [Streptomyces sp. NRRL F-4489]
MHISFLMHHAYGTGEPVRAAFALAGALAERHDVEIVSVLRHRDAPAHDLAPRVALRHLVDLREHAADRADPAHTRPSRVFPAAEPGSGPYSALTDRRIAQYLRRTAADAVVGTRPGLTVHIARQTRRGPLRIGQEPLCLAAHGRELRLALRGAYPRLDALITGTEADARAYRRGMRLPGVRIAAVPPAVPAPRLAPADGSGRWTVAAGRLVRERRFDVLIRAFAAVAAERPDWRLRIYGGGPERPALRDLIGQLGLYNHVFLMGRARPMEAEWAKGALAVDPAGPEATGTSLAEAMRCGLPAVATDCPYAAGEMVEDGVTGRLVPPGDPAALGAALLALAGDGAARARLGAAARAAAAARFDPAAVAGRHADLFADLLARRRGGLRGSLHHARGALIGGGYATKYATGHAVRAAVRGVRTV